MFEDGRSGRNGPSGGLLATAAAAAEKLTRSLVGVTGFEPATLCSQSRCASQAALHPELVNSSYQQTPGKDKRLPRFLQRLFVDGLGEEVKHAFELLVVLEVDHDPAAAFGALADVDLGAHGSPQLLL
jgi:hypothetical protein